MSTYAAGSGGKRHSAQGRLDLLLRTGVISLLVASTMNGLAFDWRVVESEITIRPDQIVLLLLAPVVVSASILGRLRLRLTLFDWAVLGFVASNLVASILFSPFRSASLKGALLLAAYAAMYFMVRQILTNRMEWLPRATNWAFGLGIAQAAYCLIAVVLYSFGVVIGGLQIGHLAEGSVAIKGTFWEANLLGSYLALIALFLTIRYMLRTERRRGWTDLFGLFVTSLALPLTVTRAAGLAFGAGVVAIAWVAWVFRREIPHWRARTVRILVTLGSVLLLTVTAMDDLVSRLSGYPNLLLERWIPISQGVVGGEAFQGEAGTPANQPGRTAVEVEAPSTGRGAPGTEGDVSRMSRSSVEGRVDAWTLALEHWQERPVLGHGTLVGERIVTEGWWYSSLVQALYDTGLVGFFALLWIHAGGVVLPVRIWLRTPHGPMSANLLGFGVGNAVLAFSSQFSNFLFVGFPWVFLGLSMAAVQASRAAHSEEGKPAEPSLTSIARRTEP